jgi:hypothetical protein
MGDERDQEAEKCIEVAKRALSDGDLQKSIKFLKKSLNFRHSNTGKNEPSTNGCHSCIHLSNHNVLCCIK